MNEAEPQWAIICSKRSVKHSHAEILEVTLYWSEKSVDSMIKSMLDEDEEITVIYKAKIINHFKSRH